MEKKERRKKERENKRGKKKRKKNNTKSEQVSRDLVFASTPYIFIFSLFYCCSNLTSLIEQEAIFLSIKHQAIAEI